MRRKAEILYTHRLVPLRPAPTSLWGGHDVSAFLHEGKLSLECITVVGTLWPIVSPSLPGPLGRTDECHGQAFRREGENKGEETAGGEGLVGRLDWK